MGPDSINIGRSSWAFAFSLVRKSVLMRNTRKVLDIDAMTFLTSIFGPRVPSVTSYFPYASASYHSPLDQI